MSLLDLFRPKWKRSNPETRKAAAAEIDDVAILVKMVEDDPDESVRLAAVARIDDQAALAEIARENYCARVRGAAVERLTDDATLAEIARSEDDWMDVVDRKEGLETVRITATQRLSDEAILADIARTNSSPAVRRAATARITDEALLANVRKREPILLIEDMAREMKERINDATIGEAARQFVAAQAGIQMSRRAKSVEPQDMARDNRRAWSDWRASYPLPIDLSGADLKETPLFGLDLSGVDLAGACLDKAVIFDCLADEDTDLTGASFRGANVVKAGQAFLERMSDIQKRQAGLLKSGEAKCDICRSPVADGEGYVLTTRQVVTATAYWAIALQAIGEAPDQFEPYLRRQCRQDTGWLTCGSCVDTFPEADRSLARKHAQAYWERGGEGSYAPPGGEGVDPADALPAAAAAWESLTASAAPETDIAP